MCFTTIFTILLFNVKIVFTLKLMQNEETNHYEPGQLSQLSDWQQSVRLAPLPDNFKIFFFTMVTGHEFILAYSGY
jgi:hypothetical protein